MFENRVAFSRVQWTQVPTVLLGSGASLRPPTGSRAAINVADKTFNAIDDPENWRANLHEEAILRFDHRGTVRYSFMHNYYTIDDDFANLDPVMLLVHMKAQELPPDCPCRAIDWERPPTYDRTRHVVAWMVREQWTPEEVGDTAYADIFFRTGHEYVKAQTRDHGPGKTWAELQAAIAAFSIPVGTRYEDYAIGDPAQGPHIAEAIAIDAAPEFPR